MDWTYGGLNYFDPVSGKTERIPLSGYGLNYAVSDIYDLENGNLFLVAGPSFAYLFNIEHRAFTKLSLPKPGILTSYRIFRFPGGHIGILLVGNKDFSRIALLNEENRTLEYKPVQEVFPFAVEKSLEYYFNDNDGNHFLSMHQERSFRVYNAQGGVITSTSKELVNKPYASSRLLHDGNG